MNEALYLRYKSISVYKRVAAEISPLAELLTAGTVTRRVELCAEIFSLVTEHGCHSTGELIKRLILTDDNPFSRMAARGMRVPDAIKAQVNGELFTFKQLSLIRPSDFDLGLATDFAPAFSCGGFTGSYSALVLYYAANGCGQLSRGNAFICSDGEFFAATPAPVSLSDLKNYAEEKAEIVRNTDNYINGLPAFHTLLFGDRGTGKTATVRAVASEYRDRLKVIELSKSELKSLPRLCEELCGLKQKYILFIDDLNLGADGVEPRAAIEHALDRDDPLVYCTSDSRGPCDRAKPYELELFDRFGLVVTYLNPDRTEFVDILRQILRSRGIRWRDEYSQIAELAAIKKGGRSPRAAKQIADLIECTYAQQRRCE